MYQNPFQGQILAISISSKKGEKKCNVDQAELLVNHGLKNDAHAGTNHRQVSLLAMESIHKMQATALQVKPGDFGENITTKDINLESLIPGDLLNIGQEAILQITQIGKECHNPCSIYEAIGDCIMPKEGVFAKVIRAGIIRPGDKIYIHSRKEHINV